MRRFSARPVALGGMLAAAACVVMGLGGLIPVATYICPMLCCILGALVFRLCGKRIAWAWYGAVAILSVLICPDREAAMIYVVLGYYPIIKPRLDKYKWGILLKLLIFYCAVFIAYWVMIPLMGMSALVRENSSFGVTGILVMALLGGVTFVLLDRVLLMFSKRK